MKSYNTWEDLRQVMSEVAGVCYAIAVGARIC